MSLHRQVFILPESQGVVIWEKPFEGPGKLDHFEKFSKGRRSGREW